MGESSDKISCFGVEFTPLDSVGWADAIVANERVQNLPTKPFFRQVDDRHMTHVVELVVPQQDGPAQVHEISFNTASRMMADLSRGLLSYAGHLTREAQTDAGT